MTVTTAAPSFLDFSADRPSFSGPFRVIPADTILPVRINIRPGGYDDPLLGLTGGLGTRNATSGSVYLDCELTVVATGEFARRRIFTKLGLRGKNIPSVNEDPRSPCHGKPLWEHFDKNGNPLGERPFHPQDGYAPLGRKHILGIINSNAGLDPRDNSAEAIAIRRTALSGGFATLKGMVFAIKVSVEKNNKDQEQNNMAWVVQPGEDGYAEAVAMVDPALLAAPMVDSAPRTQGAPAAYAPQPSAPHLSAPMAQQPAAPAYQQPAAPVQSWQQPAAAPVQSWQQPAAPAGGFAQQPAAAPMGGGAPAWATK